MNIDNKHRYMWLVGTAVAGFLALLSGILLSPVNHYLLAAILVVGAICIYVLQVFSVADRNWLDFRAVFSGVWLGTIGLAALRLAEYQKIWLNKTWFLLALAYLVMQIGVTLGLRLAPAICDRVTAGIRKIKVGKLYLKMNANRLFGICVVTTLIGAACFGINIAIKGFVPAFSDIPNAYMYFYTKFHVFAVAAVAAAPLCYYCIATQPLSLPKKILLGLCIFYLVFAFPILVVSRGVFVVAALGVAVCVYYLHGKKLWVFILSVALIGAGYLFASELRNYTDEQMNIYFQPAQIQLPGVTEATEPPETTNFVDATDSTADSTVGSGTADDSTAPDSTTPDSTAPDSTAPDSTVPDSTVPDSTVPDSTVPNPKPERTFSLSPRMAFVYSYVTACHDNFNEAVANTKDFTWGIRQLMPFNVILRISWISERRAEAEYYQVNPFLNSANILADFYYDFGSWGVALCMLLWAVIFGIVQGVYERSKNIFSLLILGNTMVPVALSFFSMWLSTFSHWLIWGVALLLAAAAYVTLAPSKKKKS